MYILRVLWILLLNTAKYIDNRDISIARLGSCVVFFALTASVKFGPRGPEGLEAHVISIGLEQHVLNPLNLATKQASELSTNIQLD